MYLGMRTGQNIQCPSHEIVMMRHCDYNQSWQNFPVENLNCCPYHHFLNFRNLLFSFSLTLQFFFDILCKTAQAWTALFKFTHKFLIGMRSGLWLANWGTFTMLSLNSFLCGFCCVLGVVVVQAVTLKAKLCTTDTLNTFIFHFNSFEVFNPCDQQKYGLRTR